VNQAGAKKKHETTANRFVLQLYLY